MRPQGTYFIFADCTFLNLPNDQEAAEFLARELQIVAVSGFSFFRPESKSQTLRFCFARLPTTLDRA
ncbi:MAG: hypothetical protein K8F91_08300, partial [Candidatus Obscuribacterales bacterium]|nr:hypothetical protein [Candidatus Obscuribacterales bacterium]